MNLEQRYLLTYRYDNRATFAWFESEDDLKEYIKSNRQISVVEKLYVEHAEVID